MTTATPQSPPTGLNDLLMLVAQLTTAQQALLRRISAHSAPVTVAELAAESDLHVSSVRETLDGLLSLGLVIRERLPANGRGRPALGYLAYAPADPALPAHILTQITGALFQWLREASEDPVSVAHQIGRNWGNHALAAMQVPRHTTGAAASPGFQLADHMNKIRLFLTAFGFGAVPHPRITTALVLSACPFTEPASPDPLALAMRHGMVIRVLEQTACDSADIEYREDPHDPLRCEVILIPRPAALGEKTTITVRYFAGAAEAAGTDSERAEPAGTLGELVDRLGTRRPRLAAVLAVSTFLVDERPASRESQLPTAAMVDVLPPFAGG